MSNKYQELPGDINALKDGLRNAPDKSEFRRIQAVYLRKAHNLSFEEIAEITCFSSGWISQIHSAYRHGGLKALFSAGKGGRYNENMSITEEDAFIAPFLDKAKSGGILEVSAIHRAYEKAVGHKTHKSVVYLLLHRNNWRKITPRPQHPKTDSVAQETFKKTGLKSSRMRK